MFTMAVFTDEVSQDLDVALKLAKEFDLDGVEIRSVWDKPPHELNETDIDQIKGKTQDAGLKIFGVAPPFFKCDIHSAEAYQQHLGILRKCIHVAQVFGTPLIRVFAFWHQEPSEAHWDTIIDRFQEPIRMAEGEGMILGLENEHTTMIRTGLESRRIIDALDSCAVKPLWDPCNELCVDDGEPPYPGGYRHIKQDMYHMHIKDAVKGGPDGAECVPMGEGEIDYRGHFSDLIDTGYDGCISLETHWRPKPEQIEKDLLNRPGGSVFSELGEEASRICLQNTLAILRDLGVER